jgi:hypothetical protein
MSEKKIRRRVRVLSEEEKRGEARAKQRKRLDQQRARNRRRGVVPRKPPNDSEIEAVLTGDWQAAVTQADRIMRMIMNDITTKARLKAGRFFDDVYAKTSSIRRRIEQNHAVTNGDQLALDAWERGVGKWVYKKGS